MYSPLDSHGREIRLVTIKAGLRSEEIQCRLTHVSLDTFPDFEALSYVWGNPNNRTSILLNGQQFSATHNLGLALKYLSSTTEDRVIWIDAICINQNDLDERSSQVQLMRDIYSSASLVVSWLGEEDTEGRAALASWLVSEAAKNNFSLGWITESILEEDKNNFMRRCFAILGAHLHNQTWEYWTRTWITQEIALTQDGVLQCGDTIIPFHPLKQLCKAINDVFWSGEELPIEIFQNVGLDGFRAMINALASFRAHEIFNANAPNTSLLNLLCTNHKKFASNPRDKVYGLLGLSDLATSSHPGVQINYRRSIRDVYMGVVEAIVDTTSKLEVLCVSCPEIGEGLQQQIKGNRRTDLPTWTPDWSQWTGPLIRNENVYYELHSLSGIQVQA
ncbi:hypothetical protein EG329_005472 [Mollisiaceae sp. DMI_Dod_QoI]|nr:hypothetical protein EG329_005472 [Helotiales sp. DMI_Dod_QoI]